MSFDFEREALVKKYWDDECERIFNETYEKVYNQNMSQRDPNYDKKGIHRWKAESNGFGVSYAQEAVDKYLKGKYGI